MFMAWLLEQDDRDDEVSRLYKAIFKDYNNGCLPSMTRTKDVLLHFLNRHPHKYIEIRNLFVVALKVYDSEAKR